MQLQRAKHMRGTLRVPGDKSIAHRALILGSIARGKQVIEGAPAAADVRTTASCLRSLGTFIEEMPDGRLLVLSKPFAPSKALDAGNSGTTARLLSGLLAGHPIETTIDGDASLRKRPMQRIADPLTRMGATITTSDGHLPLTISGSKLTGIEYQLPVPSAQIKSAILLAGLFAKGTTHIEEAIASRDHTERMLEAMSVPVIRENGTVSVTGGTTPKATQIRVPGDISSAAFFVVAATCLEGSELYLPTVGINPTRTGALTVLESMGAHVEYVNQDTFSNEPIADIVVKSAKLVAATIDASMIPSLIDELPILAVAATQAEGETVVSGAGELRHKESNRITAIVQNLKSLGADIEESPDGFAVRGPTALRGTGLPSFGDHRIAMAMAVAGLMASGETQIDDSDVIGVSYPTFFHDLLSVLQMDTSDL